MSFRILNFFARVLLIYDFYHGDRIVIGAENDESADNSGTALSST